jgi:hypothetical protein
MPAFFFSTQERTQPRRTSAKNMPRQNERIDFRVQIALQSASGKHEAYIADLSSAGCYVDTRVALSEGESVWFELIHPNGKRLPFAGTVAHSTPGVGFGLEFSNLNDEQNTFLGHMLRHRAD